jgi:hypothetical protein
MMLGTGEILVAKAAECAVHWIEGIYGRGEDREFGEFVKGIRQRTSVQFEDINISVAIVGVHHCNRIPA